MSKIGWGCVMVLLLVQSMIGQAYAGYEYFSFNGSKGVHGFTSIEKPIDNKMNIDLSCFISAADAYVKYKAGWLLVDVRKRLEFDAFRVPQAINLPAHTIVSRSFLKNKKVLLMGDGLDTDEISLACSKMKQAGFTSVFAVWGGVVAWAQSGLPLEGNILQGTRLASISMDQFYKTQNSDYWSLIELSVDKKTELSTFFPNIQVLEKEQSIYDVANEMSMRNGQSKKAILLIDEEGRSYSKYLRGSYKSKVPIFVLDGGLKAYRKYLKQQQRQKAFALHRQERKATCGY